MKKEILIICQTHGDERLGLEVVKKLKSKKLDKFFDYIIANPKAAEKKVRFIDADLNRSYPGINNSKIYEEKIACKNLERAKKYKFILDIHEAECGTKDFIIISREKGNNSFPLDFINLKDVLFWPNPSGTLGQFLNNSIELEFGMKKRDKKSIISKAVKILEGFFEMVDNQNFCNKFSEKQFYYVYEKLLTDDFSADYKKLKDFKKVIIKGESFYPLLVGQYIKNNIICYKMRKLA